MCSLVLCILLIQLMKVHGPKRPALVSIFFYAKLRKIPALPWMSCTQCIVTTQNQCITSSYYFFYLLDLNDFHRFPMVFKILLVFIPRFWLTSLRGKT